jgi:hypothetical protein
MKKENFSSLIICLGSAGGATVAVGAGGAAAAAAKTGAEATPRLVGWWLAGCAGQHPGAARLDVRFPVLSALLVLPCLLGLGNTVYSYVISGILTSWDEGPVRRSYFLPSLFENDFSPSCDAPVVTPHTHLFCAHILYRSLY